MNDTPPQDRLDFDAAIKLLRSANRKLERAKKLNAEGLAEKARAIEALDNPEREDGPA